MNSKDALKEKLSQLPTGFEDVLGAVLPSVSEVAMPSTEEDAVKVQGRLAAYLLAVFDRLAGLPILEVPLRIGQFVPAQHVLAAVGLEFVGLQEGGEIQMIMPVNGGVYYGAVTEVRCRVSNVSGVTVDDGGESFELAQESENEWAGLWAFAIGQHSITVTAGDASETVSFEVKAWETYPSDGQTYQLEEIDRIEVYTGEQTDAFESIVIEDEGGSVYVELYKDAANQLWKQTTLQTLPDPGFWVTWYVKAIKAYGSDGDNVIDQAIRFFIDEAVDL